MDDLLRKVAGKRKGVFVDLGPWIAELSAYGWTVEHLVRNELPATPSRRAHYETFWRTIRELARQLRDLGLPPLFIKCIREYQYSDANVDVLVPWPQWQTVIERLCRTHWQRPARADWLEQQVIERAKLKLPAASSDLCAAHLYRALSWRYQKDIGLLRLNGEAPNEGQLHRWPLQRFLPNRSCLEEEWIYHPNEASELVLQAAHVVFENFRITLGEVVHFILLRERAGSAWEEAVALAKQYGCESALSLVAGESLRLLQNLARLNPRDFPYPLPRAGLWRCFGERYHHLRERGQGWEAAVELGGCIASHTALRVIRRWRRWRRGYEAYRPGRKL